MRYGVLAGCQAPIGRSDRLHIASVPFPLVPLSGAERVPGAGGPSRPFRRVSEFVIARPDAIPWLMLSSRVPGFWSGADFHLETVLRSVRDNAGIPAEHRRRTLREQVDRALVAGLLVKLPDGRYRVSPVWTDQYPGSVKRDKPIP